LFSFGFFFTCFFLFAKFLPVINMAEVKAVLKASNEQSSEGYEDDEYNSTEAAVAHH
jgi:hypothetical protein